jgi:hypothetical protein
MQYRQTAPELESKDTKRNFQQYFNTHRQQVRQDTAPDFRFREFDRISRLPPRKRRLPVGDYGIASLLLHNMRNGIRPELYEQSPQYYAFENAIELRYDDSPQAHRWTIEAMLCCNLSPEEIALAVPVSAETIHYYRYYFFDLSRKDLLAKIHYIEASCQPTSYDGIAKLMAAKHGYRLYRICRGDTSLVKTAEDVEDILNMIHQENIEAMAKAAFDPNSGLAGALKIYLTGLKNLIVKTKIAMEERNSMPGAQGVGSLESSFDDMLRDDIVNEITKVEDNLALAIGGDAAKNSIEDQQKSHIQAALESSGAPKDIMSDEERDNLNFHI